jgi:hypothetical protein
MKTFTNPLHETAYQAWLEIAPESIKCFCSRELFVESTPYKELIEKLEEAQE